MIFQVIHGRASLSTINRSGKSLKSIYGISSNFTKRRQNLGPVDLEPNAPCHWLPPFLTVNVENPHYIRVPMDDGKKIVTVHVSTSALRERAAQDLQVTSNLALLYCVYRESIEAAASLKYDQGGHSDTADIVVVAREIL